MKINKLIAIFSFLALASCTTSRVEIENASKKLNSTISLENDTLYYDLGSKKIKLLDKSPLLIRVNNKLISWTIETVKQDVKVDSFPMITGETAKVNYKFSENTFKLRGRDISGDELDASLIVRLYENALAYRFEMDSDVDFAVEEQSEYVFSSKNGGLYAPNGEEEPIGAEGLDKFEKSYTTPVIYSAGDYSLAFHEADLHDYPQLILKKNDKNSGLRVSTQKSDVKSDNKLPWRVVLVGKTVADLHNSKDVYKSLSQPAEGDFSWVKPGVSTWDWRVKGTTFSGHTYEMTTESLKRYIDFCARNGLDYFLLDAEWYENRQPLVPVAGLDLKEVIRYGNEQGVGTLLYYDLNYMKLWKKELNFEEVAAKFASWGAKGIKYGFLGGAGVKYSSQQKAKRTEEIIKVCVANKLLVDFHDSPVPFGGLERQYPNYINREYCHAQMDRRWAFTPGQFVKMACVNMLAGPIDQTNGTYALNTIKQRSKGPMNDYNSTVASETARFFITHTGNLSVLIDAPEAYEQKNDLFEFIRRLPNRWDEARYLDMNFDEFVSVARRSGDSWYVGTVYNEKGGEHVLPLDFLDEGVSYRATVFADAPDTDYITNKESYEVRSFFVNSEDEIIQKVAKGGGYSILLEKKDN